MIPQTVAGSTLFFVAVNGAGQGLAWGTDANALGSGPGLPQSAALTVPISATSIAVSANHTVAAGKDGKAYGWGHWSTDGTLGDFAFNGTRVATVPIALPGVDAVVQVGTAHGTDALNASYSLALRSDGTVWHWPGVVTQDRSNPANITATVTPGQVPGLSNVVALSRGGAFGQALVIKADGTVWKLSLTGRSDTPTRLVHSGTVAQVAGLAGVTQASCDDLTCLARTTDGKVFAWGSNTWGQIGNNSTLPAFSPVEVVGLPRVKAVSIHAASSCALSEDGHVWYWGINPANGSLAPVPMPTLLTTIDAVVEIDACTRVMRRSDGSVWGMGTNNAAQLGGGAPPATPFAPALVPGIQLN